MLSSVELLKRLKEQHDKRTVSVLVGAGFSKNAIPSYPDWDGLLRDLVLEVYGMKIKERYQQHKSGAGPYYTEECFTAKEISNIIHEVGYLNLVSKYIDSKGYREAIDVYIEEHLPYVEENSGVFSVTNMPGVFFKARNLDVHKEMLICKWKHIYTTNYDNLLELTNEVYGLDYKKITTDYQLAELSGSRGIVKVHGSLKGDSLSEDYSFDNDKSRRYIISADDYATYAEKHQAFSYQMKTGLLTGVFCLIGFSGNDPNFLGWLEWMKDVLDKDTTTSQKETKVYLLTIGNTKVEKSRQLFYQNHHIGLINILDTEIQKKIGLPLGNTDVKASFIHLFRYLNDGTAHVLNTVGNVIVNSLSQYNRVWGRIDANNISEDDVKELRKLRKNIVMPPTANWQRQLVSTLYNKKEWSRQEAAVFALACVDCGLWYFRFQDEDRNKLLNEVPEWKHLQQMACVLSNEDFDSEEIGDYDWKNYLDAMQKGFRLEIQVRNEVVRDWNATGQLVVNKAALTAPIDAGKSIELIDDFLHTSDNKERCYNASVLGNLVSMQWPMKYSYNEYQAAGINAFLECKDTMLKTIEHEKKEVKPYGNSGWSVVLSSREPDIEEAFRFMELLFITGLPLQFRANALVKNADWYEVFRRVFGYIPWPALYYSLQLTDKNTLKRIGQDFAFAEPFAKITPEMLKKLMELTAGEYEGINRESCLWVAKEMLCSVAEDEWYDGMLSVFQKKLLPNLSSASSLSALSQFLKSAASHIKSQERKLEFLGLLLDHFDENGYFISELVYKLHLHEGVSLADKQNKRIEEIAQNYPLNRSCLIVAYLEQCGLLSEEAKHLLQNRINEHPEEVKNASFEVLRSLTFVTFGDEKAQRVVKQSILAKDIWRCGVDGNSASVPNYLALNKTSRDVVWTEEELRLIMDNLQTNLALLEGWKGGGDGFFAREHIRLLIDMSEFTEHICITDAGLKEYEEVLQRIKDVMLKSYGISQILDKLFDRESSVNDELQFLARCIDFYGIERYRVYVNAMIDRALLQCEKSLTMVLAFVEFMVKKHFDDINDVDTIYRLKLMLNRYVDVDYQKLNLALSVAYRCLNNVAKVLKSNGIADDATLNYWIEDEFVRRFAE